MVKIKQGWWREPSVSLELGTWNTNDNNNDNNIDLIIVTSDYNSLVKFWRMSVKELLLSHLFAHSYPNKGIFSGFWSYFLQKISSRKLKSAPWLGMTYVITSHSNLLTTITIAMAAVCRHKRNFIMKVDWKHLERMSTKTERKWKFVAHLEKSRFFIFSLKIPYSGLRNVIGFFSSNIL